MSAHFLHRPARRRARHPHLERLEERSTPAVVGYYDMGSGQGLPSQVSPIQQAGHAARQLFDLTAADLVGVDVLFVQNPNGVNANYGAEYVSRLPSVEAFVASGKTLILHDRWVDTANLILPGGSGIDFRQLLNNQINVVPSPANLLVGQAPRQVTDTNLDNLNFSNHGFAVAGTLPAGARPLLSTDDPARIVTFSYRHGTGYVVYSSIPLDFHLLRVNNLSTIYAPNVVSYGVDLLNIPPAAQDGTATLEEDGSVTGTLGASDGDGDALTYEIVTPPSHGSVTLLNTATGSYVYTPVPNFNGTDSFSFRVSDGRDVSNVGTVAITVNAVNDPPQVEAGENLVADEGTVLSAGGSGSDVDGDALIYTWDFGDGTVVEGQAVSHAYADNGVYTVTVTADDGLGGVTTDTLTVTVNNVAPRGVSPGFPQTVDEGSPAGFTASFTDPGSADTHSLTWRVTDSADHVVATGEGSSFSFRPTDNGAFTVYLTVTDDDGGSATGSAVLTASNVAPDPVDAGPDAALALGQSATFAASFTDPGSADTHGAAWQVLDASGAVVATGWGISFSFTPPAAGSFTVVLTVTDDDGGVGSDTAVVTVAAPTQTEVTVSGPAAGVRGQTLYYQASLGSFTGDGVHKTWKVLNHRGGVVARGSGTSFHFTPKRVGQFRVQFSASAADGRWSSAEVVVEVSAVLAQPDPFDPTRTALLVGGTGGADTLKFKPGCEPGTVVVCLNGVSLGKFSPTGHLFAFGQGGDDKLIVDARLALPAVLKGGAGDDLLVGGQGADVLLGNGGHDKLFGGAGRDLLIGGAGDDLLVGSGGDVLIGGRTDFDKDFAALAAVLDEWNSSRDFATRANNLQGIDPTAERLNGSTFLTVSGDNRTVQAAGEDYVVALPGDLWLRPR